MRDFIVHTVESAPEKSKPTLQGLKQKFGFLPNVLATMAESPVMLNGFVGSFGNFHSGSFNECEKQILLLTNAVVFQCPWTIAAHSTFALEDGVPEGDVQAIRAGKLPADPKYAALSTLTKALIEKKGNITETDIDRFTSSGYSQVQVFEVILGIGISTMTATVANVARTPVEDHFKAQTWTAV
jgi:alkylhydroperoxidase family enzyme